MSRFALAVTAIAAITFTGCASSNSRGKYSRADRYARDLTESEIAERPTPMSNSDIIRMKEAGISDELILSSVKNRGGEFDLSPEGVIQLSQNKVPDQLITSIQKLGDKPDVVQASARTEWADPPPRRSSVVVVTPPLGPVIRPRLHCGPRHSRRRAGASIAIGRSFCFD